MDEFITELTEIVEHINEADDLTAEQRAEARQALLEDAALLMELPYFDEMEGEK